MTQTTSSAAQPVSRAGGRGRDLRGEPMATSGANCFTLIAWVLGTGRTSGMNDIDRYFPA
jgi:hypothetical protein